MARVDISKLTDESRIWVFGISPALDSEASSRVLERVDEFLSTWSAHGAPIVSARDLLYGSFLVVAVDRQSETSGCSIDRMFGLLQNLERELTVRILDADRVFHRGEDGAVHVVSRAQFRDAGDAGSIVFDTNVERIGDVRSGRWVRAAAETWHRALLR
jgi:hypothetical protein